MARQRSYNSRMGQAVCDASNLHDGAWRCPLSLETIAKQYQVDIAELTRKATAAAQLMLREENSCLRREISETEWAAHDLADHLPLEVGEWREHRDGDSWLRDVTLLSPGGLTLEATYSVSFPDDSDNTVLYTSLDAEGPNGVYAIGSRADEASEPAGPAP